MQAEKTFAKTYTDDWDEPQPERIILPEIAVASSPAPATSLAPAPEPSPVPAAVAAPPAPQSNPVPIPLSEELDRVPGLFARSAIFRSGRGGGDMQSDKLPCYGDAYSVVYEGPRLDMREKRIWELALREAKKIGKAGVEFALSANEIVLALRSPREASKPKRAAKASSPIPTSKASGPKRAPKASGPEIKRVTESLERLTRADVEYRVPGGAGKAKLLGSARETSSGWRVSIDVGLISALRDDNQFRMATQRREKLGGDLAKWMHDFMSTHAPGFEPGFNLEELANLCGCDFEGFPARLRTALEKLGAACPELVAGFEILRHKRDATAWRVRVYRGPEKEGFRCPAKEALRAARKAKPSRKGGVCL